MHEEELPWQGCRHQGRECQGRKGLFWGVCVCVCVCACVCVCGGGATWAEPV